MLKASCSNITPCGYVAQLLQFGQLSSLAEIGPFHLNPKMLVTVEIQGQFRPLMQWKLAVVFL